DGEDEERNILQSLMRGGEHTDVIYSWNPPISINSWVNQDVLGDPDDDTKIYHSTYLTMPREWLGEDFFIQAEKLKQKNITKYRHEYLGEATGTGGQVFYNLTVRKITDEEVKRFDKIRQGLDFGFAADPLAYVRMHFDRKRMKLYIFDELYQVSLGTVKAVELLKKKNPENGIITADSEEPRSIASFNEMGLRLIGAKKGPGSVDYGMQYLSDDIEEIIIDPVRCPNAAREFSSYELEQDRNGNFKGTYPDKNNHTIDAARYALEADMARKRARIKDKKLAGFY
ncbi:MAG: terminase large subunit, partial [Acutalibacteraceae bacterium]|nr:terminase large subunit [Acutalibacteraceae bacterium]